MPQEPDYKHLLFNLLAIIHKDGGHYTTEHGAQKATEDAIHIVGNLRQEIDNFYN